MTNNDIEKEFCMDLTNYARVAIEDNSTDGDRLVARMMASLIYEGQVNKNRFDNFLKESLEKLESMYG